jgi:outer membrane protein TolC
MLFKLNASDKKISLTKRDYLPTVTLFANYDYSKPYLQNPDSWGDLLTMGANVSLPIFTGFETWQNVRKAATEKLQLETAYCKLKQTLKLEEDSITMSLNSLRDIITVRKETAHLADENYESSRNAYVGGSLSWMELKTRELAYQKAMTDYYRTLYDYLSTYSHYERIHYEN